MKSSLGLFDSLKLLWFGLPQRFEFCVEFLCLFVALLRFRFVLSANRSHLFQSPFLFLCPGTRFRLRALMGFFVGLEPHRRFFGALVLFSRTPEQRFNFRGKRLFLLDQLLEVCLKLSLGRRLLTQSSFSFIESFPLLLLSNIERINLGTKGFLLCRALLSSSLSLASERGQLCQPDFVLFGAHFCFDSCSEMRFFLCSQICLSLAYAVALLLL